MSSAGAEGSDEGLESVNFICAGKQTAYVPVPVRSGRCSPCSRISRIRSRYWCSSWEGSVLTVPFDSEVVLLGLEISEGGVEEITGSRMEGDILLLGPGCVCVTEP